MTKVVNQKKRYIDNQDIIDEIEYSVDMNLSHTYVDGYKVDIKDDKVDDDGLRTINIFVHYKDD